MFRPTPTTEQAKPQGVPPQVALREPGLYLSVAIVLGILFYAYQLGSFREYTIIPRSGFDFPAVGSGWSDQEYAGSRWTTAPAEISFPNFGYPAKGEYRLELVVNTFRRDLPALTVSPTIAISLGNQLLDVATPEGFGDNLVYTVTADQLRSAGSDPKITLASSLYRQADDGSRLGIGLLSTSLTPVTHPEPLWPPLLLTISVALVAGLWYVGTRRGVPALISATTMMPMFLFLLFPTLAYGSNRSSLHLWVLFYGVMSIIVFIGVRQRLAKRTVST